VSHRYRRLLDEPAQILDEISAFLGVDWLQPGERSGGQVGTRPAGQRQARNGRRLSA